MHKIIILFSFPKLIAVNLPLCEFLWKVQKQFLQPIEKRKIKKKKRRENSVFNGKYPHLLSFPGGSDGKESACNAGDLSSIPGLGRSPGGGHGNPLQYSCLENPHGPRRLVGYSPWGCKQSGTTERLSDTPTSFTSKILCKLHNQNVSHNEVRLLWQYQKK